MYAARSICSKCRSNFVAATLAGHSATAPAAWRPITTISATERRSIAGKDTESITSQAAGSGDATTTSSLAATTAEPSIQPVAPARKDPTRGKRQRAKSRALHLFENTVNAAQQSESNDRLDTGLLYRLSGELNTILVNSEGLPEVTVASRCFALVHDGILPALRQAGGGHLPQVVYAKATQALRMVLETKKDTPDSVELPSEVVLCTIIAELGMKSPGRLDPYIVLLRRLLTITGDTGATSPPGLPNDLDAVLLGDLLACWEDLSSSRHASRARGLGSRRPNSHHHTRMMTPARQVGAEFPLLASLGSEKLVVVLATTRALLHDARAQAAVGNGRAQGLLADLDTLVTPFGSAQLQPMFKDYPDLWRYVSTNITWSPPEVPGPKQASTHSQRQVSVNGRSSGRISYAAWHKRFGSLFKAGDINSINDAWLELTHAPHDPQRVEKLRHSPELFDFILYQCCSRQNRHGNAFYQLLGQVLKYMEDISLRATPRTYTSMMEGWKLAKKLAPIEALWAQAVKSGLPLDEHIWSSRISAHGSLGKPDDGLRILDEMSRTWDKAVENGTPLQAVQPGTASLNSAISGLLKADRLSTVHRVLSWAHEKQIEPDIWTYNRLLSYMLKKGLMDEADQILTSMKEVGIAPDGATFTIILETALGEMEAQTPEEQRQTVIKVFSEMSACGIEANQETYAKMLHVLVRAGNVARIPIEAVLTHLRGSGLQPSPEICTILFEYYFSRRPRDWDAIRALIADRRSRARVLTDRVFWETVMRHLQSAGDTAGALEIFYDMDDWGIWPSLPILEPILRTLVGEKNWDEARKFVQAVLRQQTTLGREREGSGAKDQDGRYWKHAFWAVARDFGLMDEVEG